VNQQNTSTTTSTPATKSTYRGLSAQRLFKRTVESALHLTSMDVGLGKIMWPTDFERVNRSKLSNIEIMISDLFLGSCTGVCVSYFVEHRGLPIKRSSVYAFSLPSMPNRLNKE
jgi:hypothetical protein